MGASKADLLLALYTRVPIGDLDIIGDTTLANEFVARIDIERRTRSNQRQLDWSGRDVLRRSPVAASREAEGRHVSRGRAG